MSFLRPNFVGFWACENILIEGVTFIRSPIRGVAPVLCRSPTVRGMTVESLGGVTLGSEISGGVYNVYAQNITMSSTNLYVALRLKSNSGIGGYIRIAVGTSTANNLYGAILLDGNYNGYATHNRARGEHGTMRCAISMSAISNMGHPMHQYLSIFTLQTWPLQTVHLERTASLKIFICIILALGRLHVILRGWRLFTTWVYAQGKRGTEAISASTGWPATAGID